MDYNDIEIILNGFKENITADFTLSRLIEHFKEGDVHLIVELNGGFIFPQKYDVIQIENGDIIEFINPDFGG